VSKFCIHVHTGPFKRNYMWWTVYPIYCIRYLTAFVYVILAKIWLCFIDKIPDSCLIQIWIFIHHAYVFIHKITITIQKNLAYVIQFQLYNIPDSFHESSTHQTSNVNQLQENVNTMLWLSETGHMSFVHILSTILELSDLVNVQPR